MRKPFIQQCGTRVITIGLISILLSACSGPPKVTLDDPEQNNSKVAMVYGYLDTGGTADFDYVVARRYRPETKDMEFHVTDDNLFYHLGLNMGSYQIIKIKKGATIYRFGTHYKNPTAIKVKRPGLYYMGAYEYAWHKSRKEFGSSKFSLNKSKKVKEKELLKTLLKVMVEEHPEYKTQIAWIKARIKKL